MSDMKNNVPLHIHPFLEKLGWAFDELRQAWRKTLDDGSEYSPHQADHDRAFPDALASATLRANAEKPAALGNENGADTAATAPHVDLTASIQSVGNNVVQSAGIQEANKLPVMENPFGPAASQPTASASLAGSEGIKTAGVNETEQMHEWHQFEADAKTKGFTLDNPNATSEEIEKVRQSHQFEADAKTKGFVEAAQYHTD